MKKFLLVLSCLVLSTIGYSQVVSYNGQFFKIDTLYPVRYSIHNRASVSWEITYGPDDSLWITEAHRYRIWKIHPGNKGNRVYSTSTVSLRLTNMICRIIIRRPRAG
jgi:hypothetical protein